MTKPVTIPLREMLLALLMLCAAPIAASAEDGYPARPVTVIVPYSAGGSIDLVTRIAAEGLTQRLKQTFVVENKPGGNGTIGIGAMVKAAPDGYTLQMGAVGANVTPGLVQKNYPFDPLRDYAPIAMVAEWSAVLVVKKDLPVNTLAEFVAYAKARPGKLNWGTTGFGSFAHLVGEVFMQRTGLTMQHVQYKGGAPATTDLIAGTIDAHMMSSPVAAGQYSNPRLKMLAVASKRRLSSIPNLPTMAEAGVAGVDQTAWLCLFGPPALPQAIRETLAREIVAVAHDPVYVTKLRNTGYEPLGLGLAETETMYRDELVRWSAFIKERGLSEQGRYCCKSLKSQGCNFPARRQSKSRSLIDMASGSLPKSPVSSSLCDEVPHIFTRKPRLRPSKFSVTSAKRLLQQYRQVAIILRCSELLRSAAGQWNKCAGHGVVALPLIAAWRRRWPIPYCSTTATGDAAAI